MTKIIIIEKENCKEDSIDDMNNLFKKCKFKKQEDFLELMSWNFKNFTLKLFGKVKGKSHTKFLYKFPNFEKNIYGNISIICFSNDQYYDLDLNLWNDFLNNFSKNNSELELENNKKDENFDETILESINNNVEVSLLQTEPLNLSMRLDPLLNFCKIIVNIYHTIFRNMN